MLDIETDAGSFSGVRVAVYVPCYVDQIKPQVGMATVRLLERFAIQYTLLMEPACCGQPLINMGAGRDAECLVQQFERAAAGFDVIVCPSGSCVASLRHSHQASGLGARIVELSEFLLGLVARTETFAAFPRRVLLHPSCHGLRELGLGAASEKPTEKARRNTVAELLSRVPELTLVHPNRDECCGFGGTFSITEAAVSVRMGQDRLSEYQEAGAEVVTGTDVSCLMHLEGVATSLGLALKFMHFAEIMTQEAAWQ